MDVFDAFNNLRIRSKLLIIYSAIFIFTVSLGGVVMHSFVRRTLEENLSRELQNATRAIRDMVQTTAAVSIKNHLRALAEKNHEVVAYFDDQLRQGRLDGPTARSRAREVLLNQTIGETGYIYCVNSAGVIVVHPKTGLSGADLSEYNFIREQMTRRTGYLEYDWKNPGEILERPKALYMTYFEPWDWIISVSSYRSEFTQLVKVDDFEDQILNLRFGPHGYAFVLDTQGSLVVHPTSQGANHYGMMDARGVPYIAEICRKKNGKGVYAWAEGQETRPRDKLVIYNHIPELEWIVASTSDLGEFQAPLETVKTIFLITGLGTLVLFLPITLLLSASITRPLRQLMSHFAEGAQGRFSQRLNWPGKDEVGQLAGYYNAFMAQLEEYRRNLEQEMADRARAEAAIRASEAKYRELVENANSIILRVDTEGLITFFNEFAQVFFGFQEHEVLGRGMAETILPANKWGMTPPTGIPDLIGGYEEGYRSQGIECRLRNGDAVWISWTRRAIHDDHGAIVEYLCIGNDITDAHDYQQEMHRLRNYLTAIIDSMPSVLVGVNREFEVTLWNREAEMARHIPRRLALGRPLEKLFPRLERQMAVVHQAVALKELKTLEKVPVRAGGEVRYNDLMVYPIRGQGLGGAVIRMDDVTQRVRMEEMMVQSEKMLSVGGLAAGMAHEINNPLGGMVQSAQNIQRRISPNLPANQQAAAVCGTDMAAISCYMENRGIVHFIEGIRASGERASGTVRDMLNFSRKSESKPVPTDLAELLERTVTLAAHDYDLKKKYDFRHIAIERDIAPNLPLVPCSPREIEQVVLNLIRNAAQAMAAQPAARPPRITLSLKVEGQSACLAVSDTGPGMNAETRKRIFEPFFTTKDVGIGTGLGLSVSYFIITRNHGGEMGVTSEPGAGARFTVRLPLNPQHDSQPLMPDRQA
ncbi:MAG: cache domain-containing protein [Desulfobacterales bacterium]